VLNQLAPFKAIDYRYGSFHPSMNLALCMDERWLNDVLVYVFLRLATM
jgi:hypothetical protein